MFASPLNHPKPGTSPVPYTLGRYLTMRVLTTATVIGLAVLASIGGRESQTKQPAFGKRTFGDLTDLTFRHYDQGACADIIKRGALKKSSPMISLQSVTAMVNDFKEAFNAPPLIEYENQQGIGPTDSATASSKSPSSQSSRSSSSH
jgi:hypothetical protein